MTIDRPSIAAYWPPCFKSARVSVAKPTEGAAPKRPAKLFGRRMSPSNANAETTIPPARKRMTYSKTVPLSRLVIAETSSDVARFLQDLGGQWISLGSKGATPTLHARQLGRGRIV